MCLGSQLEMFVMECRTVQVPAQWKLTAPPGMELPDSSGPNIPPWVSIAPLSGMLTPGQTVEITFRIGVPDSSAATGVCASM